MSRVLINTFICQKRGYEAEECEDALFVDADRQRYCIADGATEGFASGCWARLLVRHWVRARETILTPDQLLCWTEKLGARFSHYWARRKLPWFAEEKARSGAFSTLVGLYFSKLDAELQWEAIAVGDACLIVRRRKEIVRAFPLSNPEEFNFRPVLLPSSSNIPRLPSDKIEIQSGMVESGDCFYLLTDAIAAWFLAACKSSPGEIERFDDLLILKEQERFYSFIDQARLNGDLRNDDVGIIRVQVLM